ncbi:TetR/AcrR family transcriptional regulator [Microbacterium sp. YY-01]|uniref:TetR/AcrR family transcriptional regulator n=1 Tax=Microbacterium sp. YY-01 TaxID=3421634 RepID=UPI003D186DAB
MAQRRTYAKGAAKRQEILQAALRLIAENGYRHASVRDIAEAAGLSPAGLMHHFGTKEELFVAILEARDALDSEVFTATPASDDDYLTRFLAVMQHNAEVPGLVQLYTQLLGEVADPQHPAHQYFAERTRTVHAMAIQAVTAAQETGTIRNDVSAEWIVRSAHSLADGLQAAWLLDPTIDMGAHLRQFFMLLLTPQP